MSKVLTRKQRQESTGRRREQQRCSWRTRERWWSRQAARDRANWICDERWFASTSRCESPCQQPHSTRLWKPSWQCRESKQWNRSWENLKNLTILLGKFFFGIFSFSYWFKVEFENVLEETRRLSEKQIISPVVWEVSDENRPAGFWGKDFLPRNVLLKNTLNSYKCLLIRMKLFKRKD